MEKIRDVGKYLIAVWEATGMNMERVEFHWTSDAIEKSAKEYWTQVDKFNLLWASFVNVFSSFAAVLGCSRTKERVFVGQEKPLPSCLALSIINCSLGLIFVL